MFNAEIEVKRRGGVEITNDDARIIKIGWDRKNEGGVELSGD